VLADILRQRALEDRADLLQHAVGSFDVPGLLYPLQKNLFDLRA
jgi:hypothetical protein